MKTKKEQQSVVLELSKQLPPITAAQQRWAFSRCFVPYASRVQNTLYCLECGHTWKSGAEAGVGACPCCKKKLHLLQDYRRGYKEAEYFAIIATCGGMQVVRMFLVRKTYAKKQKPLCEVSEVMQHWIDSSGNLVTLSKQVRGFTLCYDAWIFSTPLAFRTETGRMALRSKLSPYKIYPRRSVLSVIRRNGFSGYFHGVAPQFLFSGILQDSKAETLLKGGQYHMLKHWFASPSEVSKSWASIKICMRNGYLIQDASLWLDYLDSLRYFGKDVLNPTFACPVNLRNSHDRYVKKRREVARKEQEAALKARMETNQELYAKEKGKFFGLHFQHGAISVKPLESIEAFVAEGETHRHCVFSNQYFKKSNSLILSASVDSCPTETVEVSLESMAVVQSRGAGNAETAYHNEIVNLVNSNLYQVARLLEGAPK